MEAGMADATANSGLERLYLEVETPERVRVDFQPSRQAWEDAHPQHQGELPRRPLVRFDISTRTNSHLPAEDESKPKHNGCQIWFSRRSRV